MSPPQRESLSITPGDFCMNVPPRGGRFVVYQMFVFRVHLIELMNLSLNARSQPGVLLRLSRPYPVLFTPIVHVQKHGRRILHPCGHHHVTLRPFLRRVSGCLCTHLDHASLHRSDEHLRPPPASKSTFGSHVWLVCLPAWPVSPVSTPCLSHAHHALFTTVSPITTSTTNAGHRTR